MAAAGCSLRAEHAAGSAAAQFALGATYGLQQQRVCPRPAGQCTCMQVVAAYERLAAELGSYGKLTLGVNTGKCILQVLHISA